jgi:hypothetical protein
MTTLQDKDKVKLFIEMKKIEIRKLLEISDKKIKKIDDMTPFEIEYGWRKCLHKDLNQEFARQFAEYRGNMIKLKELEAKSMTSCD